MFNLIVSGSGWQPHRDSFGSGRVLEYSDTAVAQRFMPNKVLDINAVSSVRLKSEQIQLVSVGRYF